MIYHLKLENFGPHTLFEATPQPGPNLFLGENGSGKSNIVFAIGWAILGARALPSSYNQNDIIKDGASSVTATVTLDFLGRRLTFSRQYDGKTTKAKIIEHETGDVLATNSTGVTEFLTAHGFDWDAASVPFCRQRDLDAFVHETPANRKRIIASLLQLESLSAAAKWVGAEATKLQVPQAVPDIKALGLTIRAASDDNDAALAALATARNQVLIAESELSKLTMGLPTDVDQEERDQLAGELVHARSQLDFHNRAQDSINWDINRILVDPFNKLSQFRDKAELAGHAVEKAVSQVVFEKQLVALEQGKHSALVTLTDELADNCPVCASPLTKALRHTIDQFRGGVEHVHTDDLEAAQQLVEKLQVKKNSVAQSLNSCETEYGDYESALATQANYTQAAEAIILWKKNIEQLDKALLELPAAPSRKTYDNIRAQQNVLSGKQTTVSEWAAEQSRTDRTLCSRQQDLCDAKVLAEGQKKLKAQVKTYKQTGRALKTFRDQLLQGALTWVSGRATQILQSSGDMAVAPAGSKLELDENLIYSVVLPDGTSQPVYRVSGGQAAVFSTCLRIALSEYLTDRMGMNGLLLLDAIFEPMNGENRAIVAHAIRAYGPPQTLVFSYFDIPELDAHIIPVL